MTTAILLGGAYSLVGAAQTSPQPGPTQFRALMNQYCVTCHNEKLHTAELILSKADVEKVPASAAVWEKVVRKLRTGAMPPPGLPRPDKAATDALAAYLEKSLDAAALSQPNPGRTAAHRLNRAEYANAVRDLLGVEFDASSVLPADDAGHGFDNVADILSVSPLRVEKYMSAAAKVSRLAVGDQESKPAFETYKVSGALVQDERASEELPFGSRGGIAIHHNFPLDGEYVLNVKLTRNNRNYIRGLELPHPLDIRLDGARVKLLTVGGDHKGKSGPIYSFVNPDYKGDVEQEKYEFNADAALEVRFQARAGTRLVQVAFLEDDYEPETLDMPRQYTVDLQQYKGGNPDIESVVIGGPFNPKGLSETPSRKLIFSCKPSKAEEEDACARKIVSTLARRAFRRSVTDADVAPLLGYYKAGRREGGFDEGIATAIQGVLVSPEFLFRIERDPAGLAPATNFRVSDFELASRLSFFLWSGIPDDQLLTLAEQGKLKDGAVLDQQVRRMLADARSNALVENFAGQWLFLRNLKNVSPDPQVFPDFDDNLRDSFRRETELLFESIVRENRSVLDLLRADYTFVNERLARHYGMPNIYGSHFRRVSLAEDARKGLLGQGSILTVTSYGNRTSPTIRGKWVLDNLMGTPPPPPPPNVPSLKEDGEKNSKPLTMRQRMDLHRTNPVCASCHGRMDPLGFALNNFDAVGRWQTMEANAPVDPSGVLPDGTKFEGPAGLRKILLSRPEQFVTTVTEKLMTYALGRSVEYYDEPSVRNILRKSATNDYKWESIVLGIVKSDPFLMRRTKEQ